MTELSFLPLSTREYLRQVWDYASTSEPPRLLTPWVLAADMVGLDRQFMMKVM